MNILRNPEIKKSLVVHLILAALAVTAGWLYDSYTAFCLLLISALYIGVFLKWHPIHYPKVREKTGGRVHPHLHG